MREGFFKKNSPSQSLILLLIGLFVLSIILVLIGQLISSKVRTKETHLQRVTLYNLAQAQLELIKNIAREDWHILDSKQIKKKYHPEISSWLYRKKITINSTYITSTEGFLSDFPLYVYLSNDSDLLKAQKNGSDILFTDKEGNILDFEIEKFERSKGKLIAWVKIPTLSATEDTEIYLYYGNPNPPYEYQEKRTLVWDNDYLGVWHFNTSALKFDGLSGYVEVPTSSSLALKEWSILGELIPENFSSDQRIITKGEEDLKDKDRANYFLRIDYDPQSAKGYFVGDFEDEADQNHPLYDPNPVSSYDWSKFHHLFYLKEGTINATTTLYLDSSQLNSLFTTDLPFRGDTPLYLGASWDGDTSSIRFYFSGKLEKVKIYNRALSPLEREFEILDLPFSREGLVGGWNFDEGEGTTAKDLSDFSNDGILKGGVSYLIGKAKDSTKFFNDGIGNGEMTIASAKIGPGANFDGVDDFIKGEDNLFLQIDREITISAWIKTSSTDAQMIVHKYPNLDPYPGYGFQINANGQIAFWSDNIGVWINSSSSVNDGSWHYVVVTGKESEGRFYIDGALDSTFLYSAPSKNDAPFYIGSKIGSERFFKGMIDELRISKRARGPGWIWASYNNQKDPSSFYSISPQENVPLKKWILKEGEEEIIFGKDTYRRWLILEKVSRDENGDIEENYFSPREDPSTKKIVASAIFIGPRKVVKEIEGILYLGRWQNKVLVQNSWAGGGEEIGPVPIEFSTSYYATSSNISIDSYGSISLSDKTNSGYLLSSIFDTMVEKGVAYNSLMWQGELATSTSVEIKLATSNDPQGPWTDSHFYGSAEGCLEADLGPDEPMEIKGTCRTNFYNKRFFRYKIILHPDPGGNFSPKVERIVINFSP